MESPGQAPSRVKRSARDKKYMTFSLENEVYAIDLLKVREIIGLLDITTVPRLPEFIKGVINLRGKIIPVIDLRMKIGFPPRAYDERTCIVILELELDQEVIFLGVIVDRVLEVISPAQDQIEPAPRFGAGINASFISGMVKTEGKIIALLNIQELLTAGDIGLLRDTAGGNPEGDG